VWAQTPPLGAGAPTWRSSTGCDWRGARLRGLTGVAPSRSRCVGSSASPAVTPSPESGVALSQRCGLRDRGRGAHRGQHGGGRADVVSEPGAAFSAPVASLVYGKRTRQLQVMLYHICRNWNTNSCTNCSAGFHDS
jgi:hypothetical protein